MSVSGFLKAQLNRIRCYFVRRRILARTDWPAEVLTRADWRRSLAQPTEFYADCFRYFHQRLSADLGQHREYFRSGKRGFGEDAFHVMWFLLFQEFKPRWFLEIGVFRGQVLSLISLLQEKDGNGGEVTGISPFLSAGDSVSKYADNIDYWNDTLLNFRHFALPEPRLCRAYSTDSKAVEVIRSREWDCIYIDGNHDYEVVKADWEVCAQSVRPFGIIVLDDAGLTTAYRPPLFATGGHPGPSKVAQEVDRARFDEVLQVGHNRVFQRIRS